jgi:VanZ family protein
LAYGALDERVQYYIPNRDSSPYDWMADAIGYITAGTLFLFVLDWWKKRVHRQRDLL